MDMFDEKQKKIVSWAITITVCGVGLYIILALMAKLGCCGVVLLIGAALFVAWRYRGQLDQLAKAKLREYVQGEQSATPPEEAEEIEDF